MKDLLGAGKLGEQANETLKLIYPDALQPSFKKVGLALESVIGLSYTILLPIKLLNEKASLWFNNHMKKYQEKLAAVPDDQIIPVIPDIGLPILDRLTYLENEEIAEMFINLLVNASTKELAQKAHPSFFNTLNNLCVDEAKIIKYLHDTWQLNIPYINYNVLFKDGTKALNIIENINGLHKAIEFINTQNVDFYIANLIKLGIIAESHAKSTIHDKIYIRLDEENYDRAYREAEMIACSNDFSFSDAKIQCLYYSYEITSFGRNFINVCNVTGNDIA